MNKKRVLSLLAVVIIAMSLVTFALATNTPAPEANTAATTEAVPDSAAATDSTSTTETSEQAPAGEPWWSGIVSFLPIIIIFVVFYFVLIRPENKRKKETANMRDNVAVGDEITTIGGIVGKVTTVHDDQIIIETSNEKNKVRLMKWALSTVNKKVAEKEIEETDDK